MSARQLLLIIAVAAFVIAAFNRGRIDIDWVPLGYAFVAASFLVD